MSELHQYPLLTAEEIANSPSRADGLSAAGEEQWRRKAAKIIYSTSKKEPFPNMSAGTAAMAVTFYVRFYARRSLKRNFPFIISAACLFLAGKANDEPRSLAALVVEMYKQWFGRDNPDMREKLARPQFVSKMVDTVMVAEMVVMDTMGFDLNVDTLHFATANLVKCTPRLVPLRGVRRFQQFFLSTSNDIMRDDPTLVLQYPVRSITLAICELYFKWARPKKWAEALPEVGADGKPWYTEEGLPAEQARHILHRFYSCLPSLPPGQQKNAGAASGLSVPQLGSPSDEGAGFSSAVGGSAACPPLCEATILPAHSGLQSTADKPSPEAHGGGGAAAVSGGKRAREAAVVDERAAAAGAKRSRGAELVGRAPPAPRSAAPRVPAALTTAAPGLSVAWEVPFGRQLMHPGQPTHKAPLYPLPPMRHPAKQPLLPRPPEQRSPPQPVAADLEPSDLEEGEIEEGEIV